MAMCIIVIIFCILNFTATKRLSDNQDLNNSSISELFDQQQKVTKQQDLLIQNYKIYGENQSKIFDEIERINSIIR